MTIVTYNWHWLSFLDFPVDEDPDQYLNFSPTSEFTFANGMLVASLETGLI